MDGPEIRVGKDFYGLDLAVIIRQRTTLGIAFAEPISMKVRGDYEAPDVVPTLRLSETSAQVLMDDLCKCGLRPTEGTGSAGAMAAQTRHLEDMRKLVSHAYKIA